MMDDDGRRTACMQAVEPIMGQLRMLAHLFEEALNKEKSEEKKERAF